MTKYITSKFNKFTESLKQDKDTLTLYHGTLEKHVDKIQKEGLKSKTGYDSPNWYMLSSDFESALFHATPVKNGDVYVIEFEIPIENEHHWIGYPYLWKGEKINEDVILYALKKPIPNDFIKKIYKIPFKEWLEQKNKGF